RGLESASDWLARETDGVPHRAIALEELITVWLANLNPAFQPFRELFDDDGLADATAYRTIGEALRDYFQSRPRFGPIHQNLIDMLRAPALTSPDSLEGQLEYIRHHWADLLGDFLGACCWRWMCSRKSRSPSGCGFIRRGRGPAWVRLGSNPSRRFPATPDRTPRSGGSARTRIGWHRASSSRRARTSGSI